VFVFIFYFCNLKQSDRKLDILTVIGLGSGVYAEMHLTRTCWKQKHDYVSLLQVKVENFLKHSLGTNNVFKWYSWLTCRIPNVTLQESGDCIGCYGSAGTSWNFGGLSFLFLVPPDMCCERGWLDLVGNNWIMAKLR